MLIDDFPGKHSITQCSDTEEAVKSINEKNPHIVFYSKGKKEDILPEFILTMINRTAKMILIVIIEKGELPELKNISPNILVIERPCDKVKVIAALEHAKQLLNVGIAIKTMPEQDINPPAIITAPREIISVSLTKGGDKFDKFVDELMYADSDLKKGCFGVFVDRIAYHIAQSIDDVRINHQNSSLHIIRSTIIICTEKRDKTFPFDRKVIKMMDGALRNPSYGMKRNIGREHITDWDELDLFPDLFHS